MSATIASRTPEGIPSRCPICGGMARLEPSWQGDAPCPRCGHLLWFSPRAVSGGAGARGTRPRARLIARAVRTAWEAAKSRLRPRPKPKPEPVAVAPAPSGDLYDPWIDG